MLCMTNTLEEPTHMMPVESSLSNIGPELDYTLPPYSIQVIQLDKRVGR
jgi:alpha-L-arabinofuranosidase